MSQQPPSVVDPPPNDRDALLQLLLDLRAQTTPVKVSLAAPSAGEEEFQLHEHLFAVVIGISSVGAGFTFSVIFSELPVPADEPHPQRFQNQVRLFVALSWGMFVLAIGAAAVSAQFFSFHRRWLEEGWTRRLGGREIRAAGPALVVQMLPLAAFIFSARAIAFYLEPIGWLAFGLAFCVLVGLFGLWFHEFWDSFSRRENTI